MSEQEFNPIIAMLSEIKNVVQRVAIAIQNEIKFAASVITKALLTGKTVANTALGKELGIKSKKEMLPKLDEMFGPTKLPANLAPKSNVSTNPMKKIGKSLSSIFKDVGKNITTSFSPMMLIMQILQPLIQAVLEPLDILSPLLSSWGTILSQLLIPIMLALMDVLMPFTPLLLLLVDVLLPIIEIIPALVAVIVPAIEFVISVVMALVNIIGVVVSAIMGFVNGAIYVVAIITTTIFGFFTETFSKISDFFGKIRTGINDFFNKGINGLKAVINKIKNFFKNLVADIFRAIFGGKKKAEPETFY